MIPADGPAPASNGDEHDHDAAIRRLVDGQTRSDSDQTLADRDQTAADDDQGLADRDQASADRDQTASDIDQAAADQAYAAGAEPLTAHQRSRVHRAEAAATRLGTTAQRARTTADRLDAARQRDQTAAARDLAAEQRDLAAAALEAETARSEAALTAQQRLAAVRARAAADRARAAADRAQAAADREAAASDRLQAAAELRRAHHDDLTGAMRREIGNIALQHEIDRARRGDGRLVLAFVDVDDLKAVNDRRGHRAGDELLAAVVMTMRAKLRSFDPIVRYGGDEFVCALSGADPPEARVRFAEIAAELARDHEQAAISVGIVALLPDDTLATLVERGDVALYEVKPNHG